MRRTLSLLVIGALCLAFVVPSALAAQGGGGNRNAKKNNGQDVPRVTQCELAQLLVQVLGLSRFLPASPSCLQIFAVMLDNSISPAEGWVADQVVTKADLARVIVQALKQQDEVDDPDDPRSYIDYLKSIGVPIDTVGEAVSNVEPLSEPVAPHIVEANVDPLVKRHRFNPLDEPQYAVDMEDIMRVLSATEFHHLPPVTPD